jgi:hypothetical protein
MTKDEWIQRAKALLFDCTYLVNSRTLKWEITNLLYEGGSYDPETESAETPLIWKDDK